MVYKPTYIWGAPSCMNIVYKQRLATGLSLHHRRSIHMWFTIDHNKDNGCYFSRCLWKLSSILAPWPTHTDCLHLPRESQFLHWKMTLKFLRSGCWMMMGNAAAPVYAASPAAPAAHVEPAVGAVSASPCPCPTSKSAKVRDVKGFHGRYQGI